MQTLIEPSQLSVRITAINLTPTVVAERASLHHTTLMRIIGGGNCELATLEAISGAIRAEEGRLLAHLRGLYPDEGKS